MSPIPQRRHGHGVVATAVVALACTLAPSALADPVDQNDIDRSKASERSTSTSIASLEAQLAQQSTTLEQAQVKAQVANEDYLTAVDDLNTATTDAQTAQANADNAASSTAAARSELGSIVVQTYQESGNPLDPLTPYLTSESLADLADADVALARAGENNNAKVQNVEALQSVATSMQAIADQKVKDKESAKTSAETAKSDAETAARDAQSAVSTTQTNRQNLITQLAAQRNTTVELETQYQNQVEAERKAREEAAAQAAAKEASEKAAADLAQRQAEQAAAQPQETAPAPQETAPAPQEQATEPEPAYQAPAQDPATTSQPETSDDEDRAPAPAPAAEPEPAPSYSGNAASIAISTAMSYLGTPYVWAGESASGLDCSGLTMVSYEAAGVYLTHSSRVQYGQGTHVPLDAAQPGDLVFWSSDGSQSGIYHVAIYLGDDTMIEAPTFGMTVRVTSMRYSGVMPYAVRL
ncbi:NlpC/P60 family protein [Actinomyces viscosus]|uniref:Peptidoglycan endopeptidase RipA n=1 Tax=Actinomyces viscosus TaxID=1656 RepID=A0A3S4Z3P9_ACTVI|nr:C40 family peptidase [Actinomyces viscosus]TFH53415.1 NlpC/P60 family protein [Actinomyces viscosus]VEI18552.1 Peptidoglycan endopeptidase RipA precursor [Actinomyces viscosus]